MPGSQQLQIQTVRTGEIRASGLRGVVSRFLTGYRRLAVVILAVWLSSWVGLTMIHSGQLIAFWPANGVLLAFLMTSPRRQWPGFLLAGAGVNLLTHLIHGYAMVPSVQTSLANTIEIAVAAWGFRNTAPERPDLTHAPSLLRFAIFGGVLGPVCSGLWVTFTTTHLVDYYPQGIRFRLWFISDALGIILVTPLVLALLEPGLLRLFRGWRMAETAGLLCLLTATSVLVFRSTEFAFPFLVLVVLIPVIFRIGLAGAAIGVMLVSYPAAQSTFSGHGPFAHASALYAGLFVQVYFVILLAMVYILSAILASEKRLADDLRKSEARYRALAETSQDVILRTTLQGICTYVSPSVRQVTGWTMEELPGDGDFSALIHPADQARFLKFLEEIPLHPGSHSLVCRGRRRDGQYAWLEAYVGTVFSETAVADELVWTIRDISLRVAHEERLKSETQQAQTLASTDSLTGLHNRRAFDDRLAEQWELALRSQAPVSLLMLDVDHFKGYNDTYGHQSGDECLRQIAQAIDECIRDTHDMAARYGGEEFAVLLPGADVARAQEVAERIRVNLRDKQLRHALSITGRVTISIGAASIVPSERQETKTLVASADRALYLAKKEGRDRVILSSESWAGVA